MIKKCVKKFSVVCVIIALIMAMMPVNRWMEPTYGGTTTDSLVNSSKTTGKIKSSVGANVRKSYSTSSSKVGHLKNGTSFTVLELKFTSKSNTSSKYRWYKIKTSSMTGYVRGDLMNISHNSYTAGTTTDSVNLRKGAGTGYSTIKTLAKNSSVKVALKSVTSSGSTWYKVNYNGTLGYVSGAYLKAGSNAGNSGTTSSPLIKSSKVTGKIKSSVGANVRKSYSTSSSKVGHLKNGTSFTVLELKFTSSSNTSSKYRWYKIKTSSMSGYVRGDLMNISHNSYTAGTTTDSVNLRKGAGTGYSTIKTLAKNSSVKVALKSVTSSGSTWYKVNYNGTLGYVSGAYLKAGSNAGNSGTTSSPLIKSSKVTGKIKSSVGANVRKSYSTSSSKVGHLKNGTSFTVLELKFTSKSNTSSKYRWYKIKTSSMTGYVRGDLMTISHNSYTAGTTTDSVNMRKGAGTGYSAIKTLAKNSSVKIALKSVTSSGSTWYKVNYNGTFGYVSGAYLKAGSSANPPNDSTAFEQDLISQGFPVSYRSRLLKLHEKYPNWKFKAKPVGYSWSSALEEQTSNTWANTIPSNWGSGYIYDYKPADGAGWVRASKKAVAYYMDPRNWMEDDSIFMFESQEYDSVIHKESSVKKLLEPTALPLSASAYYMEAARVYNVNPLYLATKTRVELGEGSFMVDGHKFTVGDAYKYVSADYVTVSKLPKTGGSITVSDGVNLRSTYSTSSTSKGLMAKGSTFSVLDTKYTSKTSTDKEYIWYKIKVSSGNIKAGTIGYVRADVVKATHTFGSGSINDTGVRCRTGPGTTFDIASTFNKGESVQLASKVTASDGSIWYKLKGSATTFSNCFNVFNIGASDSAAGNAATNGLIYAAGGINKNETSYGRPWNTLKKAVLGGTRFIKESFIDNNQYSPYYERFNVLNGLSSVGTHQYATSSFYAATQGNVIYNRYKENGLLSQGFVFEIPVYTGMPSVAAPRP